MFFPLSVLDGLCEPASARGAPLAESSYVVVNDSVPKDPEIARLLSPLICIVQVHGVPVRIRSSGNEMPRGHTVVQRLPIGIRAWRSATIICR